MSNARDTTSAQTVQLRRILFDRLPAEAFDRVNMTTVARATVRLSGLGWTPDDIASQILGDYGDGDPAALIVSRIQRLDGPPPWPVTPQPDPVDLAAIHEARVNAAADPGAWAERIRGQLHVAKVHRALLGERP